MSASVKQNICHKLREIGINAQIAPRDKDRFEERMSAGNSIGVIDIVEEPIRWINVYDINWDVLEIFPHKPIYHIDYGIIDPRLIKLTFKPKCQFIRRKTYASKLIRLLWKGKEQGLGILDRLNSDTSIEQSLSKVSYDIKVEARDYFDYSDQTWHRCWLIISDTSVAYAQDSKFHQLSLSW